jgi:hypothetical protein
MRSAQYSVPFTPAQFGDAEKLGVPPARKEERPATRGVD